MAELRMYEPADIEIYLRDKGMVLKEKSLVAFTPSDGRILAFGDEAEEIARKNIGGVQVISPLRQGMVADYSAAVKMFQYMIEKAWGKKLLHKPHVVVAVPKGTTEVEEKALEDIMMFPIAAKAKIVTFSEEALGQFMKGMNDVFLVIAKDEPEKYISEALSNILNYAAQEKIPVTRVEELLKAEQDKETFRSGGAWNASEKGMGRDTY
ncbi:MAG: rod shape-determining protein [Acetatifactor sp.]|nr:rod shape-determining protein [Acetatifactor sp.]